MVSNIKVNNNRRFIEKKLSEILNGYNKNNIQPIRFVVNLDTAINNAQYFENDVEQLESKLGTNLHELIDLMLDK